MTASHTPWNDGFILSRNERPNTSNANGIVANNDDRRLETHPLQLQNAPIVHDLAGGLATAGVVVAGRIACLLHVHAKVDHVAQHLK